MALGTMRSWTKLNCIVVPGWTILLQLPMCMSTNIFILSSIN